MITIPTIWHSEERFMRLDPYSHYYCLPCGTPPAIRRAQAVLQLAQEILIAESGRDPEECFEIAKQFVAHSEEYVEDVEADLP